MADTCVIYSFGWYINFLYCPSISALPSFRSHTRAWRKDKLARSWPVGLSISPSAGSSWVSSLEWSLRTGLQQRHQICTESVGSYCLTIGFLFFCANFHHFSKLLRNTNVAGFQGRWLSCVTSKRLSKSNNSVQCWPLRIFQRILELYAFEIWIKPFSVPWLSYSQKSLSLSLSLCTVSSQILHPWGWKSTLLSDTGKAVRATCQTNLLHIASTVWSYFVEQTCVNKKWIGIFSRVRRDLHCQYVSVCDMWHGATPLVSSYARFRAGTLGLGNSISIICVLAAEEATSHLGSWE